jgi:beta-glucosidase
VPGETYFAPFPVSVTLDGDLSDWEGVPTVVIPPTADSIIGSTSVEFAATADDEFLYLMGDVTDSTIVTGLHGTDYWNEDSVEFYINGTGDLQLGSYADGVAQITVPPLNAGRVAEEIELGGIRADTAEVEVVVVETPTGYTVELAVPLQNRVWNIRREHGATIGFQVHLNSASQSSRDLKVIWSNRDTADTSYLNPSVFGNLTFFEIGETDVVVAAPPPAPEPGPPVPDDALYKQAGVPLADRVEDLLAAMTLTEKVGQMTLVEKNSIGADDIAAFSIGGLLSGGGGSPEENTPEAWAAMVNAYQDAALSSRTGVPLLYGVDAVHGHNNVRGAVIFPHNVGLGAASDPNLMERIGQVTAAEMIATGIYWNYAPAVSVPRDIRWGRTYEGYSEDTDVVSTLAAAYLRGLQGDDLADGGTVLATPKHYVGDGGTAWGSSSTGSYQIDQGVTEVDETELRAVHLPPYLDAIDEGAASIMVSYSSWDGPKMHAQRYLIDEVLKGELGYEGFIVSDWGAIDQISNDYNEAVAASINAGVDMNMVPHDYRRFITTLTRAVEAGDVSEDRIDDAVRRILTIKFALGLFERPYGDDALLADVGSDEHRAVAREAVAKSQVLLKNDGRMLPLAADVPTLFVGGQAADDIGIQSGGWTIEWQGAAGDITEGTTILEAIRATVSAETEVVYEPFGRFDADTPAVCLAVVGEVPYAEGFGDSADLRLPVGDLRVLNRMEEQCERLAVVLVSGRPLIVTDLIEAWDALVAAWLPGTEGQGVVDVLFGLEPFAGALPYTWPRSVDQLPLGQHDAGEPLFPFGFGL